VISAGRPCESSGARRHRFHTNIALRAPCGAEPASHPET